MAKYYGIVRTDEYLAHYGVKGMKWGVVKEKIYNKFKNRLTQMKTNRANKKQALKLEKRINEVSNAVNPMYKDSKHDGYFKPAYANGKPVYKARNDLYNKMAKEVEKRLGVKGDAYINWDSPKAKKAWNDVGSKHKKDYLKAVLTDANIPINKNNLATAHRIISSKDKEYNRYR